MTHHPQNNLENFSLCWQRSRSWAQRISPLFIKEVLVRLLQSWEGFSFCCFVFLASCSLQRMEDRTLSHSSAPPPLLGRTVSRSAQAVPVWYLATESSLYNKEWISRTFIASRHLLASSTFCLPVSDPPRHLPSKPDTAKNSNSLSCLATEDTVFSPLAWKVAKQPSGLRLGRTLSTSCLKT